MRSRFGEKARSDRPRLATYLAFAAAFGLSRVIATFLYGVKERDLVVFTMMPLLLASVSLLAVWLPARRATRIDPLVALRYE